MPRTAQFLLPTLHWPHGVMLDSRPGKGTGQFMDASLAAAGGQRSTAGATGMIRSLIRHMAGLALLALIVPALPARAHEFDEPIDLYVDSGLANGIEQLAIGDVNGDGLDDIVTLHRATTGQTSMSGRIGIMLQRRGGGFEFPRFHACNCSPDQLKLFNFDSDPAQEILYKSVIDDYSLPAGGFEVLEILPDGQELTQRYVEGYLRDEAFSLVDVNQDGYDDLFFAYYDDDNTTPQLEYRYAIWYHVVHDTDSQRGRHGFTRYQGDRFLFSGIDDSRYVSTPPVRQQIDLDGDGYYDAIEGRCTTLCLFRQEPWRQLVTAPITDSTPGDAQYGDIDGDGLPDRLSSIQLMSHAEVLVELQTTPTQFAEAGSFAPLSLPGPPLIGDFDNNGLTDFAVLSEKITTFGGQGWLSVALQTAPGQFATDNKTVASNLDYGRLFAGDFNADGCRDLIAMRSAGPQGAGLLYFRGRGCEPASDLLVSASFAHGQAKASIDYLAGSAPSRERFVRVVVAPAIRDDSALELVVQAPPECAAQQARAPRRIFDCYLPALSPGDRYTYAFPVRAVPGKSAELQVTAFLQDDAGDSNTRNNRSQVRAQYTAPPPPAPRGE